MTESDVELCAAFDLTEFSSFTLFDLKVVQHATYIIHSYQITNLSKPKYGFSRRRSLQHPSLC